MSQLTKNQLSAQEQWWLTRKWPQYLDAANHLNPDPEIIKLLIAKHLVVEKKDWITKKPIFYLTSEGELLKKEIK